MLHRGMVRIELESVAFDERFELFVSEQHDANWVRQLFGPSFIVWLTHEPPEGFTSSTAAGPSARASRTIATPAELAWAGRRPHRRDAGGARADLREARARETATGPVTQPPWQGVRSRSMRRAGGLAPRDHARPAALFIVGDILGGGIYALVGRGRRRDRRRDLGRLPARARRWRSSPPAPTPSWSASTRGRAAPALYVHRAFGSRSSPSSSPSR